MILTMAYMYSGISRMARGGKVLSDIIEIITRGKNTQQIIIPPKLLLAIESMNINVSITVNHAVRFFDGRGRRRENRIPHNASKGIALMAEITISHAQTISPGYCSREPIPGKLHPPQATTIKFGNPANII